MSPEEKELLKKSVQLAEDNNKMLHSIRRSMRISSAMTIVYWAVIIGSAIGAYYFLQPYLDQVLNIYNGAKSSLNSFNSTMGGFKK